MDKQQKLKIALPVLVVIMIIVWGSVIIGGGSKHKKADGTADIKNIADLPESSEDLIILARSNKRKKARTSHADWGRNPFTLTQGPKASVLEGIMWDAQYPQAIINGNILGVGDPVGPGTIVDIQPNSVTIEKGGVEKVYRLGQ